MLIDWIILYSEYEMVVKKSKMKIETKNNFCDELVESGNWDDRQMRQWTILIKMDQEDNIKK